MKLEVLRFSTGKESTIGALFDITKNRRFLCFTLEDQAQTVKVYAETRIPAGTYNIGFRHEGRFHTKYTNKFGEFHKGMLEVQDIPNFKYVLIHIGNTDDDTAGCLLLGDSSQQNITMKDFIGQSTNAYKRVYPVIAAALEKEATVTITYTDYDE